MILNRFVQLQVIFLMVLLSFSPAINAQSIFPNSNGLPNIIYILADDLGIGDVSSYNERSRLHTKNIDHLASEGLMFTDAHSSSSVCTPTRYGILTGRYNWRSRLKKSVLGGYSKALIDPERLTVAKLLQEEGYQTGFIGKWHLGWDWAFSSETNDSNNWDSNPEVDFTQPIQNGPKSLGFNFSYGFSGSLDMPPYVYVENDQPSTIPQATTVNMDEKGFWREGPTGSDFSHVNVLPHVTQKAIAYIDEHAKNHNPFFLYLALPAPHTPILPTTEFMGKSNSNFYGDFVLQVDDVLGQVLKALDKNGIRGETMVIFTSDNGCSPRANFKELAAVGHNPSYIYRGHKADIYEGGHRVPFIVSWPNRIPKQIRSKEIICTTDFLATVAEVVGRVLPDNAGEDSFSFLPVLFQESLHSPLRDAIVHHSIDGRFAIRQGDWKLILCPGSGGWSFPMTQEELMGLFPYQLYNLKNDPSEENNLAQRFPQKVTDLKFLLTAYIDKGRSTPGIPQKNDGPLRWEELDWVD